MNNINANTFNLHNSLFNYDNRYMKVTLKSKIIGVARLLISADYCLLKFRYKTQENFKRYF